MTLEELKKFCAHKNESREFMQTPFSIGEWTYATNGHIGVRVPRIEGVAEGDLKKVPKMTDFFAKKFADWVPVPVVTIQPDKKCSFCNGTGTVECNLGHDHDCEDCGETHMVSGYTDEHKTMIGDSCFADIYLAMIQRWEISPDPTDTIGAAGIRGNGATGLLMPRRV